MTRLIATVLLTILLAVASTASASSGVAVASARVIRATIVTTEPLVEHLSVSGTDLQRGYISIRGATVNSGRADANAFTVRVEIPSIQANSSFPGDATVTSSRIPIAGTETSLRQSPFAYITYDGH